jgi:aquaporin Z
MSLQSALREHWPEYLIEAWALGCFMVSAGVFATLLGSPQSPLFSLVPSTTARTMLVGLAMGVTAILLIHSPWGKRSGAHMNPAVTLTFLRLGKVHPSDALFYVVAQVVGGTLGVVVVASILGCLFTDSPVSYAVTVPGPKGVAAAFVAETVISFGLMATVLTCSSSPRLTRFTGLAAGCLVALFISVESPLSGMSMNPARTFASAAPGMIWQHFWIYLLAPPLGMLAAAQLHLAVRGSAATGCAKLLHPKSVRCIHCGYNPDPSRAISPDLRNIQT